MYIKLLMHLFACVIDTDEQIWVISKQRIKYKIATSSYFLSSNILGYFLNVLITIRRKLLVCFPVLVG